MTRTAKLLVIDPQNDFCDIPADLLPMAGGQPGRVTETPALAVSGAHADMLRTADFITQAGRALAGITVTLDWHPFVAIERTTFWQDADGREVAPFTPITAADVSAGKYVPVNGDRIEPLSGKPLTARVIELLGRLEAAGRYTLMVWPVHCVAGTWGANIHRSVADALAQWERGADAPVIKAHKGQYFLTEHYGAFEAETPLAEVPSTQFDTALARGLTEGVDTLFVAGEASSHCVSASVDQLIGYRRTGKGIVLITDCMSPVSGFAAQADAFLARARDAGSETLTAAQALQRLRAN